MERDNHSAQFIRTCLLAAILLFVIPLVALGFCSFAEHKYDGEFSQWVEQSLSQSLKERGQDDPANRAQAAKVQQSFPAASVLCTSESQLPPQFESLRESVDCSPYQQFQIVRWLALAAIALGLCSCLVALGCAYFAHRSRELQYSSFVTGWWFLRIASTLQLLIQGSTLIWLSVWFFILWIDRFSAKLTLFVALFAGSALLYAIKAIFAQPELENYADGRLLKRDQASDVWARIEELCEALKTQAPKNIIVGIDENFYVTESELEVKGEVISGRSLYMSLSLLRVLSYQEADAIFAHEMAHFSGGDTESTQRLRPKLASFELYLDATRKAYPVFAFMRAYYLLFIRALQKDSRDREFRADKMAAQLVSPTAVAHSLIKACGYASYRERIHDSLLQSDNTHDELAIPERLARGIENYAREELTEDLATMNIPHPFDSHPPLVERIKAVGLEIEKSKYGAILLEKGDSWYKHIEDAQAIEKALWEEFQEHFASYHEFVLAHRYLPSTEQEAELVAKHFPTINFSTQSGRTPFQISHTQMRWHAWPEPIPFTNIAELEWVDQTMVNDMVVRLHDPVDGKKKYKMSYRNIADQEEFQATVSRYFARYLEAQEYQAANAEEAC